MRADANGESKRYYRPMHRLPSSNMNPMKLLSACAILLLAGCAQVRYGPGQPETPGGREIANVPRYEPVPNQDAATVAELRVAPPPKEPQIAQGTTPSADEQS